MIFRQQLDKGSFPHAYEYEVLSKKQEAPAITTLSLARVDGTIPAYCPGQCITVYFPDLSTTLGKQYSISSAPCEGIFSVTVKNIGGISCRLCSCKEGDLILASEPGGNFYLLDAARPAVMLAGGMGVTPFRSMLLQGASGRTGCRMMLLHSGKCVNDMPFLNELNLYARSNPRASVKQFLTQECLATSDLPNSRLDLQDIPREINSECAEYFICGSLSFVLGLKNRLLENGIGLGSIHTEAHWG
mgnify:FL=1